MTSRRSALVIALVLGAATGASAGMVRHAGEWTTTIDGGPPLVSCATHDAIFDNGTIQRLMGKLPGATCSSANLTTLGPITTFRMECDIYGNHMVSSGTVTQTGFDSYTTRSHTHIDGGRLKMQNGQSFPMPDQDMTSVSRRTGACKPGDRIMKE